MWRPGLPEILIVLFIILLLFGPGRIANIARELGNSITAFRQGMNADKTEEQDKIDQPKE
jgi:sec-independent protein translocase protein TatA